MPGILLDGCGWMIVGLVDALGRITSYHQLCGFAYGGFWALNPTMVSELFGLKHLGANYNLIALAPAASSYSFSVGIAATLYSQNTLDCATKICLGKMILTCSACPMVQDAWRLHNAWLVLPLALSLAHAAS